MQACEVLKTLEPCLISFGMVRAANNACQAVVVSPKVNVGQRCRITLGGQVTKCYWPSSAECPLHFRLGPSKVHTAFYPIRSHHLAKRCEQPSINIKKTDYITQSESSSQPGFPLPIILLLNKSIIMFTCMCYIFMVCPPPSMVPLHPVILSLRGDMIINKLLLSCWL